MHMLVDVCVAKPCCLGEKRLSVLSCYISGDSVRISDTVITPLAPQTTIIIERSGENGEGKEMGRETMEGQRGMKERG